MPLKENWIGLGEAAHEEEGYILERSKSDYNNGCNTEIGRDIVALPVKAYENVTKRVRLPENSKLQERKKLPKEDGGITEHEAKAVLLSHFHKVY